MPLCNVLSSLAVAVLCAGLHTPLQQGQPYCQAQGTCCTKRALAYVLRVLLVLQSHSLHFTDFAEFHKAAVADTAAA
jgi:hypothetical protein